MLAGKKKKVNCCRTWLELDPFCSLQGVWKAEITIPGHKGQRNKSGKSRRDPSRVQRGGKNSPLVCTFMQWCRYTDRAAQKALRYGTSRWIKEEINCRDFGNSYAHKGTISQTSSASPRTFCRRISGAVVYRTSDAIKAQCISPLTLAEYHHSKHKGNGTWSSTPPPDPFSLKSPWKQAKLAFSNQFQCHYYSLQKSLNSIKTISQDHPRVALQKEERGRGKEKLFLKKWLFTFKPH